jgi:hypothetical protein
MSDKSQHESEHPEITQKPPHLLSAEAFILRLAEDLRAKGDSDLPVSFYAEQAKQSLLNGQSRDAPIKNANVNRACDDKLFQSWALDNR